MKVRSLYFLSALSLISGGLLFFRIDHQSLWLDEMMSLEVAGGSLGEMKNFFRVLPEQHPLYYILLKGWLLWGSSETVLRSLSAVFAIGSLWGIYFLGRLLFNESVGKLAAVLLAVSPFYIYYGQEARMYTLVGFFAIVNSLFFVYCDRRWSWWSVSGYLVSGILGLYTHFFFAFLVGAQTVYLLLNWKTKASRIFKYFLIQFVLVLSYLPWAIFIILNKPQMQEWKGLEHIVFSVPYTFMRFGIGYSQFVANSHWKENIPQLILENSAILILAIVSIGWLVLEGFRHLSTSRTSGKFLLCGLFLPMVGALLASSIVILVGERYFIICFPFYVLLLAVGILQVYRTAGARRLAGIAVIVLFAGVNVKSLYDYYFSPSFGKTQWRDAAAYVESTLEPNGIVFVQPGQVGPVFKYYFRGPQVVYVFPLLEFHKRRGEIVPTLERHFSEGGRVILVTSGPVNPDAGYGRVLTRYAAKTMTRVFELETGITCTLWEKKHDRIAQR